MLLHSDSSGGGGGGGKAGSGSGATSPAFLKGVSQAAQQAGHVISKLVEAEERLVSSMYGSR